MVLHIYFSVVIVKNLTYFRKTLESDVDPHLFCDTTYLIISTMIVHTWLKD